MELTIPLAKCFGPGEPGWLVRDMPPNTTIDFQSGRVTSPAGAFVRSPSTGKWARTH